MKFCTNCGKEIPENTMFCPNCGAKNTESQPYASVVGPQTAALYTKPGAFSFSGRARRSEYWTMAIANLIYSIVFLIAFLMVLFDGEENVGPFLILSLLGIPLEIWSLAVQVRRLHDLGYSGWFVLLAAVLSSVSCGVVSLAYAIVLGCMDGEPGPNRFGLDPKGRGRSRSLTEEEVQGRLAKLIVSMVTIPERSFMMGRTEVTQAQWEAVMGYNPSKNKGPDLPVENVSWNDCQAFIEKLNAKTGKKFRLPTEEEWEYACRAGGAGDWGKRANGEEGPLDAMGWYRDNSDSHTHPVGQKEPNAFGLYDMHGNVWEWTATAGGARRVLRGGCYCRIAGDCTASLRGWNESVHRSERIGFRLALSQKLTEEEKQIEKEKAAEQARIEKEIVAGQTRIGMVPILGRSFMMGRTEVTQAQWEAIMGNNPSENQGPDLPVENVSWDDCQKFIEKLNAKTGKKFRLPTEEEWEYACRAGGTGDWGKRANGEEGPLDAMGWYEDNSDNHTHPVGQKEPNAFGLYDMYGNVWEWTGTADGAYRVLRGGCCWLASGRCTASYRDRYFPDDRFSFIGFRLVLSQD